MALTKAAPRQLAPERAEATAAKVREKAPEAKAAWKVKITAILSAIGTGVMGAFEAVATQFSTVKEMIEPVREYLSDVPGWVWLLLTAVIAGTVAQLASRGETAVVKAWRSGERR
ncbi:MAG: hypothetical protein ACRCTD_15690 [Beijerinckiaceae bacterium]